MVGPQIGPYLQMMSDWIGNYDFSLASIQFWLNSVGPISSPSFLPTRQPLCPAYWVNLSFNVELIIFGSGFISGTRPPGLPFCFPFLIFWELLFYFFSFLNWIMYGIRITQALLIRTSFGSFMSNFLIAVLVTLKYRKQFRHSLKCKFSLIFLPMRSTLQGVAHGVCLGFHPVLLTLHLITVV